ncbi:parietopsin [Acipenser oxyrinchus oxyrinchus]|uniref:Parietopsin n=1 Tax=Acipenser oxyrinchus oxyrinchus TaxID=40147 RepID=A0AAD8DCI9_ACIOX|nr:parietopsin [Acipenser oxyrinchus oxyrinchus]
MMLSASKSGKVTDKREEPQLQPPKYTKVLLTVFSIFNNVQVIAVTLKNPHLHIPISIFIRSFSDLMIAVCSSLIVPATNCDGYFFLGEKFYTFQGFAVSYFGIVSLWTLTILAYERHNIVCQPIGALKLNQRKGYQGLPFIWFFCLLWTVAPLLGWSSYGPEGVQTSCSIGWEKRSSSNYSYQIAYILFCFIIPVIGIVFSYCSLHKVCIAFFQQPWKPSPEEEACAVIIILAMAVAFLVSWLPYIVFALVVVIDNREECHKGIF